MAAAVTCLGAGTVGRSWAIVFARAGMSVTLWDIDPGAVDRAMAGIAVSLADIAAADPDFDAAAVQGRVGRAEALADAIATADWVQESIAEDVAAKRTLFAQLDSLARPDSILASSTSAIPGSEFLTGFAGAARCLIAHPVNPPHLIPLVELCGTSTTHADTVARARAFMQNAGQAPIVLEREVPGFVLNRLQWALLGEAMHLVNEGVCTPADLDRVLTDGLARRWALLGPFATCHLNATGGFAGYSALLAEALSRVRRDLAVDFEPDAALVSQIHESLAAAIPVEDVPARQRSRDKALIALDRYLAGAARAG